MQEKNRYRKIFFTIILSLVFLYTGSIKAANPVDYASFNVEENFDVSNRSQIQAVLVKQTNNIYFYIEKTWWDAQLATKKEDILAKIDKLSSEFDSNIYPTLTSVFGQEWKPGVDGDNRITVFLHFMREGVGGYFREADEHLKLQIPSSNEREMVYLPLSEIESDKLKVFLAHEFLHLITFNQKDRINGVKEEVWLNEVRADYSATVLGYNTVYEGSNLQRRVRDFLNSPSDSLTEWQESKYDYASVSVFMHYLVDHYGVSILSDSLASKSVGMQSINEALLKNGYQEDFATIFTNWSITTVLNDCSKTLTYCYLNPNLKNLRISPTLNFLPISGDIALSVTNVTKNWAGNWQKIIGGNGKLELEFSSLTGLNFKVPYILYDKDNHYLIDFVHLDASQKGKLTVENFGSQYISLIIIPSLQTKTAGFNSFELTYPYNFKISVTSPVSQEDQELIQSLLVQIDALQKEIVRLKNANEGSNLCSAIQHNLYIGVQNINEVKCLQQFLKNQGIAVYPEGLVTGYFGNLTRMGVIRFQEMYRNEILAPVGLGNGTGFVGLRTRNKINQLL